MKLNKILDLLGMLGIGLFYPFAKFGSLTTAYELLFIGTLAFALLGGRLRVWGLFGANLWASGWLIYILAGRL
jgi:hypothetical protein